MDDWSVVVGAAADEQRVEWCDAEVKEAIANARCMYIIRDLFLVDQKQRMNILLAAILCVSPPKRVYVARCARTRARIAFSTWPNATFTRSFLHK